MNNNPETENFSAKSIDQKKVHPKIWVAFVLNLFKEKKSNTSSDNFFTKRKIIAFTFWAIVLAVLIGVVIRFVLNLDFQTLASNINNNKSNSLLIGTFLLAIFLYFFNIFSRIYSFWIKSRKKVHIQWYQWMQFATISFFIQIITPFSFGSEPYAIWWMKKRGLSIRSSTIIIAINSLCWSIGQVIVTWPSFIAYSVFSSPKINAGTIPMAYWWVLVGLVIDLTMFSIVFAINYSRRVHVFISVIFNKIKKLFRLKYLSHEEIIHKYVNNAVYKKQFRDEFLAWNTLIILLFSMIGPIVGYFIFVMFFTTFAQIENQKVPWNQLFNIVNITTTANNFIPIPNTEGTLQVMMKNLLLNVSNNDIKPSVQVITNSLFMWRASTSYSWFFTGIITTIIMGLQYGIAFIIRKQHIKKTTLKIIQK